jgi:predicted Zn-dependent peptidase
MYGDHQMGRPTAGTEETVGNLQRDDFRDWIETWYGATNIVLSIAGNVTHETVMELAGRYFANSGGPTPPPMPPITEDLPAKRIVYDIRDISQTNMALSMPGLAREDPDRYILMILNAVLGRGMSSRLFKEVRERRGLAYSVGSSVSRHSDTGTLSVSAGVSPEKALEAATVILEELEKLVKEPVPEGELKKARDYTVGSFRLSLESTMALGQRSGEALLTMGKIEPIDSVVESLRSVTAEEVQRVAERVLRREKTAIALVGPSVDEAALESLLTP